MALFIKDLPIKNCTISISLFDNLERVFLKGGDVVYNVTTKT